MQVRMSVTVRASLILVPLLAACSEAPRDRASGPGLALAVAPLSLPDVRDACYGVTITNGLDQPVATLSGLCADRYGDGVGAITYIAPCDASPGAEDHTVSLILEGLYAGNDQTSALPTTSYVNPCPASAPCTLPAQCAPNADTPVRFDLVVMRRAEQGFFDIVVDFDDIFCSAKLDCLDALMPGADGERLPTVVLGLACTGGELADTCLYLSDITIACTGECAGAVIPSTAGPGRVTPLSNVGDILKGASIYRGDEQLGRKTYWNVAMAIDPDAMAAAGTCTLTATATASDGVLNGATPSGTTYPKITFSVPLYQDGQKVCSQHPLDALGSGVATGYTTPSSPMPIGPAVCHGDDGAVRAPTGCAGTTTWGQTAYLADGDNDGTLYFPPGFDPACVETIAGDLIIVGASGAVSFPRLTAITGQLVLAAASGATLSFPRLASIGQMYIVTQVADSTIHQPHLVTIGRDLLFSSATGTTLEAPALRTINGGLELQSSSGGGVAVDNLDSIGRLVISGQSGAAPELDACSLREITSVVNGGYAASLVGHVGLTSLSLPRLEVIRGVNQGPMLPVWQGGRFDLNAPALVSLELPRLREAPFFNVFDTGALVDFELPSLETIGWLFLTNNAGLERVNVPNLRTMERSNVSNNPALLEVDFSGLETHGGMLDLASNPALHTIAAGSLHTLGSVSFGGLPSLATLDLSSLETFTGLSHTGSSHSLAITGPTALTGLDLSSLISVANGLVITLHDDLASIDLSNLSAAGSLIVEDLPSLTSLSLDALTTVVDSFVVASAPLLSYVAMTSVLAQLVPAPPTVTLCGLAGGPTCP